jgi:hypothetical protein
LYSANIKGRCGVLLLQIFPAVFEMGKIEGGELEQEINENGMRNSLATRSEN